MRFVISEMVSVNAEMGIHVRQKRTLKKILNVLLISIMSLKNVLLILSHESVMSLDLLKRYVSK